jgi:hypothetical protein
MKKDKDKHKKLLIQALERNLGIVTGACKDVGISRTQFYNYYKEDPEFRSAVDDINEITIDFAETQLLKKIKEGSERSILFYMKYKGRNRGYSESINIDMKMEQPLLPILPKKEDDEEEEL